ncbi:hypothetical protein ZIOFF_030732 [Zingiber officinale]|uniref:Uncharacterized protein n=1 Tax=Zingiber officinale TaxID=94328 RepID=A0A8J5LFD9_ZINOF|nr:hypothetical protein ZIOFF_030732 [Zingiber officinale]
MDGKNVHGRMIRVNYATDQTGEFHGGGYGGSYGSGGYGGGGGAFGALHAESKLSMQYSLFEGHAKLLLVPSPAQDLPDQQLTIELLLHAVSINSHAFCLPSLVIHTELRRKQSATGIYSHVLFFSKQKGGAVCYSDAVGELCADEFSACLCSEAAAGDDGDEEGLHLPSPAEGLVLEEASKEPPKPIDEELAPLVEEPLPTPLVPIEELVVAAEDDGVKTVKAIERMIIPVVLVHQANSSSEDDGASAYRYLPVLHKLSKFLVIDYDKDKEVHCFSKVVLSLCLHKELNINPARTPNGYFMVDIAEFLRQAFSLERDATSNIEEFAGVHGSGLTNLVFLLSNATVIQLVSWGSLEWMAILDFREPAKDMKLNYVHPPAWVMMSTFMDNHNVKLDIKKFKNADAVAPNNKALCLMYSRGMSDSIKVLEGVLERVPTAAWRYWSCIFAACEVVVWVLDDDVDGLDALVMGTTAVAGGATSSVPASMSATTITSSVSSASSTINSACHALDQIDDELCSFPRHPSIPWVNFCRQVSSGEGLYFSRMQHNRTLSSGRDVAFSPSKLQMGKQKGGAVCYSDAVGELCADEFSACLCSEAAAGDDGDEEGLHLSSPAEGRGPHSGIWLHRWISKQWQTLSSNQALDVGENWGEIYI